MYRGGSERFFREDSSIEEQQVSRDEEEQLKGKDGPESLTEGAKNIIVKSREVPMYAGIVSKIDDLLTKYKSSEEIPDFEYKNCIKPFEIDMGKRIAQLRETKKTH